MLCNKCKNNPATIQLSFQLNGVKQTHHLCTDCYQQEKQKINGMNQQSPFENYFSNFSSFFNNNNEETRTRVNQQTKQTTFLEQFGRNLNDAAKAGMIDPIIGRDQEIQRVIEILNRRNKNNPVLIGEPGVGKTAIAEGLALKIIEDDVPVKLKNKQVYLLDVASLVANTGVRGQFEERMKQLIEELQANKQILLFIDEIHLLVGAGSAEGSMDAGNILKPALARGDLQVIGATTLKEYRQIEKDAALERRFQPVTVNEPSLEKTIDILQGLKEKYEAYHQVSYSDEVIRACVELSHRYIQDRFLPDKAIDLMDEAGSKLNLTLNDMDHATIYEQLKNLANDKQTAIANENYELAAKLKEKEAKLEKQLQENDLVEKIIVDVSHIHEIIETKTGIPVGKLQSEEQMKLSTLESELNQKVIGQEEAVKKITKAIRRSRAGLKTATRPIGSFLFVGPTGVGKTELTKTLAEQLFGTKDAYIRLDMSEYMEKHSVSKLIGSPPGYVGHDEAGQLTEKIRRNPYSIVLLDEIEKAHPDVQHMFLQILEDGRLTDSQGRTVSFKDTVIIMTSNAGNTEKPITVGFGADTITEETSILESLGAFFKPEFLNRFDSIIQFNSLSKDELLQIVDLLFNELTNTVSEQGFTVSIKDDVKEKIVELGYVPQFGARPLRRVIQEQVEDQIADFILDHPDSKDLIVSLNEDNIMVTNQ